MNISGKSKTLWPGARAARRRLMRITLVLLPLSLVVFALLVRDWKLNLPEGTEESTTASRGVAGGPGRGNFCHFFDKLAAGGPTIFRLAVQQARHPQNVDWPGLAGDHRCRCFMPRRTGAAGMSGIIIASNWRPAARSLICGRSFPNPFLTTKTLPPSPSIESWFTQRTNFAKKWADNYSLASSMIGSES